MCESPPQRHKRRKTTTTECAPTTPVLQRKKQAPTKTAYRIRTLQKPLTPPRCRKTKQSTLTSVWPQQEVADHLGIPVEDVGVRARAAEVDNNTDEGAIVVYKGSKDRMAVEEEADPTEDRVHDEAEHPGNGM